MNYILYIYKKKTVALHYSTQVAWTHQRLVLGRSWMVEWAWSFASLWARRAWSPSKSESQRIDRVSLAWFLPQVWLHGFVPRRPSLGHMAQLLLSSHTFWVCCQRGIQLGSGRGTLRGTHWLKSGKGQRQDIIHLYKMFRSKRILFVIIKSCC